MESLLSLLRMHWDHEPTPTPPRRGTERTRTDACSPPGRGRGWVGSWRRAARPQSKEVLKWKLPHRFDDVIDLFVGQFGIHRQRENSPRDVFGDGQIAGMMAQLRI